MGEAVGAALLALATLRLWDLHEYVHEVGLQPGHLARHPVLTGGELQDDLLQSGQTAVPRFSRYSRSSMRASSLASAATPSAPPNCFA